MMWPQYTRGVPVHATDERRTPYGIVQPRPGLVAACPELAEELVLARSAQEARGLADVLPQSRIVHLDLPRARTAHHVLRHLPGPESRDVILLTKPSTGRSSWLASSLRV
ncbi:hypothetical protein ACFXJ6_02810 [Streptomyces sp. NPDC059218]|uniref:hypothetical protein n=1 Tax=Streptomyces sp. NPDC059218 TaxID=3346773 RepID=UPI0036C13BDF